MADSELFDMKNSLYIGNYQHCINEAQKLKPADDATRLERDVFQCRAWLSQAKYGAVLSHLRQAEQPPLVALRLLAQFLQAPGATSPVIEEMEKLVSSSNLETGSYVVALAAATMHAHQGEDYEAALRVLNTHQNLECRAMMVHCYLGMFRVDAARKELKAMAEKDDDHTLTQLATAWVHLATGGDKLQDAFYIYQELIEKNQPTALLVAGQSCCQLGLGRLEEAESCLIEAQEKDHNQRDALANMALVSQLQGNEQKSAGFLAQLRDSHPQHRIVKTLAQREECFDRLAEQFRAQVSC